ncbi:hypothetical protein IES17_003751 [Salmonella enterica subsp. enterica serovar Tennessee]|nr:hypothetical protein [Salmonella enterica subsp. enterica serovar Tennessee]
MFPAPAGINRLEWFNGAIQDSVPRASGDKPLANLRVDVVHACSPRQRG